MHCCLTTCRWGRLYYQLSFFCEDVNLLSYFFFCEDVILSYCYIPRHKCHYALLLSLFAKSLTYISLLNTFNTFHQVPPFDIPTTSHYTGPWWAFTCIIHQCHYALLLNYPYYYFFLFLHIFFFFFLFTTWAGHDPWASHRPWPAPPAAKAPRRWSLPLCRAGTGTLFPLAPQGRSCRGPPSPAGPLYRPLPPIYFLAALSLWRPCTCPQPGWSPPDPLIVRTSHSPVGIFQLLSPAAGQIHVSVCQAHGPDSRGESRLQSQ